MKKISIGLAALTMVVAPTLFGTPESKTVEAAEAVYTCGTPRWGAQYYYKDQFYRFIDGYELRYRQDYRWYCHPQGYWYKAIYYQNVYWMPALRA